MDDHLRLDLSGFSKELKVILQIVKMQNGDEVLPDEKELFSEIDWKLFLRLAMIHRVFPVVYLRLKKLSEDLVPGYVTEYLRKQYYANTLRMLYLSRETEQISRLFLENDVQVLILKGPVLAFDFYGDVSLRPSVDIDILVSIKDLDKVHKLLIESGYNKYDFFSTELDDWKWRIHHLDYIHAERNFLLEVHWRLHPGPSKEPGFDALWERKRKSLLTDYPVYYLEREDLFLFLVTHGARHGWEQLGWLVDIDRLVRQGLELDKLNRLLKKYQCRHIGGQALILASELLDTPVTQEIKALEAGNRSKGLAQEALFYVRQIVNLHSDEVSEEVRKYHSRYLFSLMSFQQKCVFIMSVLHPYPMDAQLLPLPKYLHFLYFPLRPVFWVWRKFRQIKK